MLPVALGGGQRRRRRALLLDGAGVAVVGVASGGSASLPGLQLCGAGAAVGRRSPRLVGALLVAGGGLGAGPPTTAAPDHVRHTLVVTICSTRGRV